MPINEDGEIVDPSAVSYAPKGLYCPYCNIRESNRTTVVNKQLKWLCDVCFKEILEYEQQRRQQQQQQ